MKWKIALGLMVLSLGVAGYVCVRYYSYVFSKEVSGEVFGVEWVAEASAMIVGGSAGGTLPPQVFSFAIAVRDRKTGEIYTASSEDRQWAVVSKGQCVTAEFFPYPPWHFEKARTYFGARLLRIYDCPEQP